MLPQLLELVESTRQRRARNSGVYFSPYYIPYLANKPLRSLSGSDIARFFVARRGAAVLCVLLAFAFHKRAYALWIGCGEEGYRVRAPAFVWLNAIRELKTEGAESLNLAGAGPESRIAFAKTSLGAQRHACTGCVSPYLKGPLGNLLFQTYRWMEDQTTKAPLVRIGSLGEA